jgi:hypothetical protein
LNAVFLTWRDEVEADCEIDGEACKKIDFTLDAEREAEESLFGERPSWRGERKYLWSVGWTIANSHCRQIQVNLCRVDDEAGRRKCIRFDVAV